MERETREIMAAKAGLRPPIEPLTRCEWWRGAALYQVYVRSFRDANGDGLGDLAGVREKLDYIRSLNVDGLWLSPFNPSPQADFGYDITDLTAVDPIHGTMEDFRGLLADAHERGLKLLLDLVVLHTSEQHPWFLQSRESRDNPRADWYVWADAARDGGPPSNWLSSFGGSAWQWEPRRAQYYYHPFLREQPALDLTNPEVLEEIRRVMRFWLDEGVDGFRVDAVQCLACDPDLRDNPPAPSAGVRAAIGGGPNNPFKRQAHYFDRDVPEAFPIIHAMRQTVDAYTPERALIGELADVDSSRLSEKYTADGTGFHAVYDFDMIQASADHAALAQLVSERSAFLRTGWLTNMFSNHDSRRAVSGLTRKAEAAGLRVEAAKMLIFLQFALKGGGILYQGEELGLPQPELAYEDLRDPWGRALWPDFEGRDGARTPMPWTADAHPMRASPRRQSRGCRWPRRMCRWPPTRRRRTRTRCCPSRATFWPGGGISRC